jgi:hypothetical protein
MERLTLAAGGIALNEIDDASLVPTALGYAEEVRRGEKKKTELLYLGLLFSCRFTSRHSETTSSPSSTA